jgi:amidophosphoribosyltransferase
VADFESYDFSPLDHPGEECGVFGVYNQGQAPGDPTVGDMTYKALLELQNRGHDAAGMAVADTVGGIVVVKQLGRVEDALHGGRVTSGLDNGAMASGHVRYITSATKSRVDRFSAAQPILESNVNGDVVLSHNGHIANSQELIEAHDLDADTCGTDSQLMTYLIAKGVENGLPLQQAVNNTARELNGAFSLVIMGQGQLIGLRDPRGTRPLMLGELPSGGSMLASETTALDVNGARFVREIEPGEMIVIDKDGPRSSSPFTPQEIDEKLCVFEKIYFSDPRNILQGSRVEDDRFRMGEELGLEHPVGHADIVVGIPNSGMSAAEGYSEASGIPLAAGLERKRRDDGSLEEGRSFMFATQEHRRRAVRDKLAPIPSILEGKVVVAVDDSVVRGTTTGEIIDMFREGGAREVHLRVASPPYQYPCFAGMDTPEQSSLIAANMTLEEIAAHMGVDSLQYLSLEGLHRAAGNNPTSRLCDACLTGDYPNVLPPRVAITITPVDHFEKSNAQASER